MRRDRRPFYLFLAFVVSLAVLCSGVLSARCTGRNQIKYQTTHSFESSAASSEQSSSNSAESSEDDEDKRHFSRSRTSLDEVMNYKVPEAAKSLRGQALVDYVNSNQFLWTARLNPKFEALDEKVKRGMMGVRKRSHFVRPTHTAKSRYLSMQLPDNFDAREQWSICDSLRLIRDQSACGSCWAFGAVEAMSDRICIATGGLYQVALSADDLLSCCKSCGDGCNGGDPMAAWNFWVTDGIVTGSNKTTNHGCRPYPFPPCEHHNKKTHYKPCQHKLYPTPKCETTCQASYTKRSYSADKFYGRSFYKVDMNVTAIQYELFTNGPLEIAFSVYEDFLTYDGGIYTHRAGDFAGGHAVKLVGWGVENGIPYWTVANSWNTDWGEDGFFRILRGKDECNIEEDVIGGQPDLNRLPNMNSHHHRSHQHHRHRGQQQLDDDSES